MFNRTQLSIAVSAALATALVGTSPAVMAQTTQQLDRVEVTGSSIKRIGAETALPVQIITREEIARTGASNVEQLMQTIAANSSSGSLTNSSASSGTTLGISAISLRGLGSQRTLVLINGRRVSPYGYGFTNDNVSVDVNSLPLAAIDRVEILKDGASAIYGSDAIAGVVNFILRREYTGIEATAEYGAARDDSGSVTRASATFGFGDLAKDRYNAFAVVSYQKEKALFGRDRAFAASGISLDNLNDTTSGNTFPANIFPTDGSFGTRNPSFPACPGPYAIRSPVFDLIGSQGCRFDPSPILSLFPETERYGFFASGRFDLTPSVQLFAEGSFYKSEQNTRIQPTPISDQFTIPLNNPLAGMFPYSSFVGGAQLPPGEVSGIPYSTIVLTSTSPFYPTAFVQSQTGGATPDLLIRWRASAVGDRDTTDTSEASRLVLGARGTWSRWEYQTALLYSASDVKQTINDGFVRYTQIMPLLNSGQVNFFGPQTPAVQAALDATKFTGDALRTQTSLLSLSGTASTQFGQLAGGPIGLALGVEGRKEDYQLDPALALQQGDLTGFGGNFFPVDRDRNVYALFAEVAAPVLRSLELNAAVRYDDYEGVGSSVNPKVGIRYQPVTQVLLRASAGTGFRAPSLLDLYAPQTTGVTPPGLNDPIRCPITGSGLDCVTQFPITNGGATGLVPEESRNVTVGIVLEPTNNISLAVDYFNIKLEDVIRQGIPAATILSDLTRYGSLVTRGAPQVVGGVTIPGPIIDIQQTSINLGRAYLAGIDVDLRAATPVGTYGQLGFSLNGTYFTKYDTENPDGSFTSVLDTANNNTGGVVVRWRHYAAATWTYGPLALTFAQQFQKKYDDLPGSFEDPTDPAFIPRKVGAYEIYHLQGVYNGFKNLTLTLGARNIFDKDPPYTNAGGQTSFQAGYDPLYADPRGRFFYGRVTYKFL